MVITVSEGRLLPSAPYVNVPLNPVDAPVVAIACAAVSPPMFPLTPLIVAAVIPVADGMVEVAANVVATQYQPGSSETAGLSVADDRAVPVPSRSPVSVPVM